MTASDSGDNAWENEFSVIPIDAPVKFNSGEHADIPSECKLPTGNGNERVSGRYDGFRLHEYEFDKQTVATTFGPKEISYLDDKGKRIGLTFSQILALAGDFFCNKPVTAVIARGRDFNASKDRFNGAIEDMVKDKTGMAPGVQKYLSDEIGGIEIALADVPKPGDEKYEHWQKKKEADPRNPENMGPQNIVQNYVKETGGVSSNVQTIKYVGAVYGDILTYNMDHFGDDAWTVYKAGHTRALEIAKAGKGNVVKLKQAYMYDAFALHYLTDQFASGHIRTPRPEFNRPTRLLTALNVGNAITSYIPFIPESFKMDCGAWDRMTNFMHDTDGSVGLRISNQKGESWITYGDKQYFAEPNRINRLKSLECAQSSIDEVFAAWRDGQYPEVAADSADSNAKLKNGGNTNDYAALQIAPLPMTCLIQDNHDATGNASSFWIVERNDKKPDVRNNAIFGGTTDTSKEDMAAGKEAAAKETAEKEATAKGTSKDTSKATSKAPDKPTIEKEPPPSLVPASGQDHSIDSGNNRISGKKQYSENGYFFARRSDPELCSSNQYQWGWPGYEAWALPPGVSWDVSAVENSDLKTKDLTPPATRAVEIFSGGFLQVQEYCKRDGTVNYAVNVWGPIQTPIRFLSEAELINRQGRAWTDEEIANGERQYTFTFRGRSNALTSNPEIASNSKNYKWHSWADSGTSGKTSLLKFTHSYKNSDPSKQNAIVVEAWSMIDPYPKTPYQYTLFESLKSSSKGLVFEPSSDKVASTGGFGKIVLVSNLKDNYYESYAHMTRFFISPFSPGSSPVNPDIVTVTWTGDDTAKAQCVISVASTGTLLTSPTFKLSSKPQSVDGKNVPILSGFLKRFEDVNNKAMILHARATEKEAKSGLTILPQVYYYDEGSGSIVSKDANLQMTLNATPAAGDNYQILVGDTKFSGHREMVVVAGAFPHYYISAWKLTNPNWMENTPYLKENLTWEETTPVLKEHIKYAPGWETQSQPTEWPNTNLNHRLCAFIPNEPIKNGLNVLLVSYNSYQNQINFRTYIKGGEPPLEKPADSKANVSAPQTTLPPNQTQGAHWNWVIVSFNDKVSAIVPSWLFIVRSKPRPQPPIYPPAVSDKSPLGSFGANTNLNNFAKQPIPSPDTWPISSIDMALVTCPDVKAGSLDSTPIPVPVENVRTASGGYDPMAFAEETPRQKYPRFEAISMDVSKIQPSCVIGWNDDRKVWEGWYPDWSVVIRTSVELNGRRETSPVWIKENWSKDVRTTYVYDTVTKRPTAVVSKQVGDKVWRILNPEELFKRTARDVQVPQPQPQVTTSSPTASTNLNKESTLPKSIPAQPRPKSGWLGYVDCIVPDEFSKSSHFTSMGWRMVKLGSIVNKKAQYGVMNVFSFHGMLGVRVWAPAEPGRWNQWISRGMTPYLGQTSLGTGWDSSGQWNDNASQLSWGACEDFADANIWHGSLDKGTFWNDIKGGWATPYTQAQKPYARGYESKKKK